MPRPRAVRRHAGGRLAGGNHARGLRHHRRRRRRRARHTVAPGHGAAECARMCPRLGSPSRPGCLPANCAAGAAALSGWQRTTLADSACWTIPESCQRPVQVLRVDWPWCDRPRADGTRSSSPASSRLQLSPGPPDHHARRCSGAHSRSRALSGGGEDRTSWSQPNSDVSAR